MKKTLKRRKAERKTDYKRRIGMLKSGTPRITFRLSNKYVISQYIKSKQAQDKIEFGVTSKVLFKNGWPKEMEGSLNSLPASYLTGLLMGRTILEKKLEIPIVDLGMIRSMKGNKFSSFLKGVKDSGLKININEETFPSEERISGKHLKEDFSKKFQEIKSKIIK